MVARGFDAVWIQLFLHDGGTAFSRHQFRSVVVEIAEPSNYNFILQFEIDKMLVRFAQMETRRAIMRCEG
jgi:hypothetical protein